MAIAENPLGTQSQEQVPAGHGSPGCTNACTARDGYGEGELLDTGGQGAVALLVRKPHPAASVSFLQNASFYLHDGEGIPFWSNETSCPSVSRKTQQKSGAGETHESDVIRERQKNLSTPTGLLSSSLSGVCFHSQHSL